MSYLSHVYQTFAEYAKVGTGIVKWSENYPEKFELITSVERMRIDMEKAKAKEQDKD